MVGKIRKAKKEDLKEIIKLMIAEFSKPPWNEKVTLNAALRSLEFYFKIGKIYIAVENKIIIGVVVFKIEQYWEEGPIIIIEDLAVNSKFQRRGMGKKLMDHVENYARKKKIKFIIFNMHKKSPSLKFYKRLGYKQDKNAILIGKKLK